jgi:class 3 adenylate cyclase/CHASE2 domain-containing sensor protein
MGLAIGSAATIVGGIVYALGWLDRLDGYNLDLHFRHFNGIEADPRIVLIDIDDSSLQAMPDWPWPRRVYADLVRTLHELGPKAIVLDLVFDKPSPPRTEHAGLGRDYDIDTSLTETGDRAFDEIIYDDDELRDAMAGAGNVYLAMFARIARPGVDPYSPPYSWWTTTFAHSPPPPTLLVHTLLQLSARRFFDEHPTGSWPEFLQSSIPYEEFEAQTPGRNASLLAYRREKAIRSLGERLTLALDGGERLSSLYDPSPPIEKLVDAAKGVGLVSFYREQSENVVRSLPLAVELRGKLLAQLAPLVASEVLGLGHTQISDSDVRWVSRTGAEQRRVPIDGNGESLVNWYSRPGGWTRAFRHIPAAQLLEIVQNRRAIEDNARRLAIARAELVQARHADTPAAYQDYVKRVNERLALSRANTLDARRLTELNESAEETEDEAAGWVRRAWSLWQGETPRTEEETAERDHIKRLFNRFGEGRYAATLDRANVKLKDRGEEVLNELRPLVAGKICLVGYTATALADVVATPVDPAMPGVMVHANVINMFLQNRFAAAATLVVNLGLLFAAGITATFLTTTCRPRVSVPLVLALGAGLLALGATLFATMTYHLASIVAVGVTGFAWASVTAYRQATEERARRAFHRALAQYTSPAVATRIAERTRADDLAPQQAFVTCFFSDLADFTRLSERLGPQRTRGLLEPYLRGISAALLDHGAIVNKFMGDGVFAFFNAPILPCPDHAAAACDSALAAQAAIARWNDQRRPSGELGLLTVRIGLSTGEAFVGDYGSDMKLDYTCIGDTVNLGSRLERANKTFGTAILVDEATRRLAGDGFAFRSLGRIEVAGKAAPVCVYELVGRVDSVDESARKLSP